MTDTSNPLSGFQIQSLWKWSQNNPLAEVKSAIATVSSTMHMASWVWHAEHMLITLQDPLCFTFKSGHIQSKSPLLWFYFVWNGQLPESWHWLFINQCLVYLVGQHILNQVYDYTRQGYLCIHLNPYTFQWSIRCKFLNSQFYMVHNRTILEKYG